MQILKAQQLSGAVLTYSCLGLFWCCVNASFTDSIPHRSSDIFEGWLLTAEVFLTRWIRGIVRNHASSSAFASTLAVYCRAGSNNLKQKSPGATHREGKHVQNFLEHKERRFYIFQRILQLLSFLLWWVDNKYILRVSSLIIFFGLKHYALMLW